jgi:uncharacterized membrane protein SpoIIM required for sporulation
MVSVGTIMLFILVDFILPLLLLKMLPIETLKRKTWTAAIAAAVFVVIGFFTAALIFQEALSTTMLAFTSLFLLPFVVELLRERKKLPSPAKKGIVGQIFRRGFGQIVAKHDHLIKFYTFLFFGLALSYMILFALLPVDFGNVAFKNQLTLIGPKGYFDLPSFFLGIVSNNMMILLISFFLSVFYGAGSMLVLSYNASVAGVLYGLPLRTLLTGGVVFTNIIFFLPHTIIEILAYLLGAVAGGILVTGLDEENVVDAVALFSLAVALVFVGGLVEVTIPFLGGAV